MEGEWRRERVRDWRVEGVRRRGARGRERGRVGGAGGIGLC